MRGRKGEFREELEALDQQGFGTVCNHGANTQAGRVGLDGIVDTDDPLAGRARHRLDHAGVPDLLRGRDDVATGRDNSVRGLA